MSDTSPSATVCPLCAVGCRLERGDGSRAQGVEGPANPEGRLCRKGVNAFDVGDERLTEPRVRRDGTLQGVDWSSAYDRTVEAFEAVVSTHGPDALAFLGAPHCTNEENYLLQKLARAMGTNNVDNRARLCHVSAARTLSERVGWPATTNSLSDLGEADVILVAGANPAERQPVAFNSFVRPAVEAGATLVHIDPVGNRTTRLADVHVAPRPGTDAQVFDLLSAHVLSEGSGIARSFVEDRTRGFNRFAASLATLDWGTATTSVGLDAETVARTARQVGAADSVAALVGTGVEGTESDRDAASALLDLLLLTGNIGRPGTGLYILRGLVNEQGATDAGCVPDRLPGHQPVGDPDARARVASEWGVEPPAEPGESANELLESFGNDIRGALVVGENPAISKRDDDWVRERLRALDVLVVLDIMPNRTTRHADVVLPAAAGVEKSGTVTNLERRVQRSLRTATPPGRARPDFAVLADLGDRLVGDWVDFDYSGPAAIFDELTRVAPTYAGVSYPDLDGGGRQWPFDDDGVLYDDTFATDDGRAAFGTAQQTGPSETESGFHLVTGGRTSEFDTGGVERTLQMHPGDASERGLDSDDRVAVSDGETAIEVPVELDSRTRRGTVYLPAEVADPFLRAGTSTVTVSPGSDNC